MTHEKNKVLTKRQMLRGATLVGSSVAAATVAPMAYAQLRAPQTRPQEVLITGCDDLSPTLSRAVQKASSRFRGDYADIYFLLAYRKFINNENRTYDDLVGLFNGDRELANALLKETGTSKNDLGGSNNQEKRARPFWKALGRIAGAIVKHIITNAFTP